MSESLRAKAERDRVMGLAEEQMQEVATRPFTGFKYHGKSHKKISEEILNVELLRPRMVNICYRNWKGVTSYRTVRPIRLFFGSDKYYPEPQWLMEAIDFGNLDERCKIFPMCNIFHWEQIQSDA